MAEHLPAGARLLHLHDGQVQEWQGPWPHPLPAGCWWLSLPGSSFDAHLPLVQGWLTRVAEGPLLDLHVMDLLNAQLPSHFEPTSRYDLLVFRRLASLQPGPASAESKPGDVEQLVAAIDTSPVGFAVYDHVLLTVHPSDCSVRDATAARLLQMPVNGSDHRGAHRLPDSPADLMLRMVNQMVDGYLDLRRLLSRELGQLQRQLLDPRSHYADWAALQTVRDALHHLEETCEDQRASIQEWIDTLGESHDSAALHERELLRVRSHDVLEHIERVISHVRRTENALDNAVQMHLSLLGHRTNAIMRTLTVLTAIFLPLNLITGIFGMNFDTLPLIHSRTGAWVAFGLMLSIGISSLAFFWRKRYLGTRG